jgi:hypothetical protein
MITVPRFKRPRYESHGGAETIVTETTMLMATDAQPGNGPVVPLDLVMDFMNVAMYARTYSEVPWRVQSSGR